MHNRNGKSLESSSQKWRSKRLDRLVDAASSGDYGGWGESQDFEHHIKGEDENEEEEEEVEEKPTQEEEDELRDEINEDLPEEDD